MSTTKTLLGYTNVGEAERLPYEKYVITGSVFVTVVPSIKGLVNVYLYDNDMSDEDGNGRFCEMKTCHRDTLENTAGIMLVEHAEVLNDKAEGLLCSSRALLTAARCAAK
jgi:hypothetical protein